MSKLYIKLYDPFELSGRDIPVTQHQTFRRLVFSPDNVHSVSVVALRDGTLLISNESKIPFEISLSRNQVVVAVLKYEADLGKVDINGIWSITKQGVKNLNGNPNPNLFASPDLDIDFQSYGIGRVDVKIDDSGFACCLFISTDLLFVRMNGNHVVPRFIECINTEAQQSQPAPEEVVDANPGIRKQIGQKFVEEWMKEHEWGLK